MRLTARWLKGQRVRAWNQRGGMELAVRITENTRPGVVTVLWGHWATIPVPAGFVNDLTSQALADMGGGATFTIAGSRWLRYNRPAPTTRLFSFRMPTLPPVFIWSLPSSLPPMRLEPGPGIG